jgi:hypothetical protein
MMERAGISRSIMWKGSGAKNTTYSMPNFQAYVVISDQNSVNQAKEYLDQIEKDQRIQVEQKD